MGIIASILWGSLSSTGKRIIMNTDIKILKQKILWITTVLFASIILMIAYYYIDNLPKWNMPGKETISLRAEVVEITNIEKRSYGSAGEEDVYELIISFNAKLLKGEEKGKIISSTQILGGFLPHNIIKEVEIGDDILVVKDVDLENKEIYYFSEYYRLGNLLFIVILFSAGLLLFGRRKGLNTLLSLIFTIAVILFVFVPSILTGINVYLSSILTCFYTIIVTLLIVNGYSKKTLISIIGCMAGVLISGILCVTFSSVLSITGLVDEDSIHLLNLIKDMDMVSIVFAAMIIGSMGAIMDVAMSIASSLHEISINVEKPTFSMLMKSGINIGRDLMGTMANTLILAYIGSFLTIVVLYTASNESVIQILNREMLVIEILQGVVGSFGILLTLPITSLLASVMLTNNNFKKDNEQIPKTLLDIQEATKKAKY